jgi:hypothetical protein
MRSFPLTNLKKIPADKLPKFINELVHVSWARRGCVWRLRSINGKSATLETPTTKKIINTSINYLYAARYNELLLNG